MAYKWCGHYNCFCDEVEEVIELIDGDDYCDFDCGDCDESEQVGE